MNVPDELRYSKDHEWASVEDGGGDGGSGQRVRIGITDYAQDALGDHPETVNGDPYGDGWLCVIEVANEAELQSLLDASAYRALIEG
jgi:glycine cleavage system H lipoate-binding protein